VTDAEIQATYDKAKAGPIEPEYRARHILVKTEAEAKKLIADLGKKAKFEDLAKKYSKDPGSAKNGGALDWSDRRAFVPEFSDALAGLKKGETTKTPVKTQFGYHVIRLDDTRQPKIPRAGCGAWRYRQAVAATAHPRRHRGSACRCKNRIIS